MKKDFAKQLFVLCIFSVGISVLLYAQEEETVRVLTDVEEAIVLEYESNPEAFNILVHAKISESHGDNPTSETLASSWNTYGSYLLALNASQQRTIGGKMREFLKGLPPKHLLSYR